MVATSVVVVDVSGSDDCVADVWGQASAQLVPVWVSPSVLSRRRLIAAARWCSQWSFLATPR